MTNVRAPESEADWAAAAALLHDHVEWVRLAGGIDLGDAQPGLGQELRAIARGRTVPSTTVLVAWEGDLAVGIVTVRRCGGGAAELKRMYVRPVGRGRGIADRLVEGALERAVSDGCSTIWLETQRGAMDRAIAFYRRHGFAEIGEPGRTLHRDDIVVMERSLDAARHCA